MFRRSISLKSSGGLVVRIIMAYHNQADSYALRTERNYKGQNRGGGFTSPNARPVDGYGDRPMETFSKSFPRSEASRDNGVQGSQFSSDGSHQNYGNNPRLLDSYPHDEMRGNGRGRGRGHRNDDREGAQPGHHHGDLQKVDRAQSHQQRGQPDPYQSDSQKGNRTQGHEQQAQSGPNQRDSQKGDMAQRNSMKGDMAQGYRQGAEPDSYQGDSQEGRGGALGHGQGDEAISYQGDSQKNIDRGQHNGNDSRQGFQAVFDQKDSQKGTEGVMARGLEQDIEPGSYKGDSQVVQPIFDQKVSQKGKLGDHVQGTHPSCNKGNSKEQNDLGQSHGNDTIQRTQPGSHQKDSQKGSDRGQSHGNDSGQWNKHGPNQGSWRKGDDSSGGYYQENRSHSYQWQTDSDQDEWMEVYITSVEESQSAVEYIMKQKEPVSIICCGEKLGEADGKITVLAISIKGRTWIYQLCSVKEDLMEAGKLKHLFFDSDLMKVFHDVAWQSCVLFKQYEIVLDGTKVFDSKVVCQQKLLDKKAMDSLRLEGFMPTRWMEEDRKIDNSRWTQDPLDKELINKLVERCKALLQFYKMFTMQKLSQPKKEIYTEVNKYVDLRRANKIRKIFKSQTEEHQDHSASNGKGQNYRRKDDIERLWWKNRLESFGAYGQEPVEAFLKNVPGTESSKDHGIQGHGKKLMEYNHGEHGVSVSQTYHLGREHHEALDYQNQGSVEEVSRKGKINREAKEGIEKEEILEHAMYEYEEKDTDPICLGVTPTELKLPSTLREQRNPAEELLLELAVGSADAEDETEPCNRDQRRGRMDTLSGSPAPSSRDKTEDLLGLSPPWPVALDPAPEYNQLHLDPNNFFLGAPSTVIKSHAATVLQNVRRRAICHKDGRKVEFLSPDSAACVLKKERCVLPDGSIYELTSTWIPDPECKEKKEQSSQTEKSITETMETGIQCDIIKLNI